MQTRVINKQNNYHLLLLFFRLRGKLLLQSFLCFLSLHQTLQNKTTSDNKGKHLLSDEDHKKHETHANTNTNEHRTVILL